MTPKEKATELIYKFTPYSDYNECDVFTERENQLKNAIQCALICVDEIIRNEVNTTMHPNDSIMDYWEEVKQEINKL